MPTYVSTHGAVFTAGRTIAPGEQFDATPEQVAGLPNIELVVPVAPVAPIVVPRKKASP